MGHILGSAPGISWRNPATVTETANQFNLKELYFIYSGSLNERKTFKLAAMQRQIFIVEVVFEIPIQAYHLEHWSL